MDETNGRILRQYSVETEFDLRPEYCQYQDEGCALADSCLHCPFPRCVHEERRGGQRWLTQMRDREMARLFAAKAKGVGELAIMFGVGERTVRRALRGLRDGMKNGKAKEERERTNER